MYAKVLSVISLIHSLEQLCVLDFNLKTATWKKLFLNFPLKYVSLVCWHVYNLFGHLRAQMPYVARALFFSHIWELLL